MEVGNSYEIDKLLLGHLPRWRCMQKRTARMLSMKSFIMRAVVSLKGQGTALMMKDFILNIPSSRLKVRKFRLNSRLGISRMWWIALAVC